MGELPKVLYISAILVPNIGLYPNVAQAVEVSLACDGSGFMYGFPEDRKEYRAAIQIDGESLTISFYKKPLQVVEETNQSIKAYAVEEISSSTKFLHEVELNRITGSAKYWLYAGSQEWIDKVGATINYNGMRFAVSNMYRFDCKIQKPLF